MGTLGPCCPACGTKVKLPKNAPLPPPQAKVKCPSCGGVGELEAFVRAAMGVADSGSGAAVVGEDPPAAETMPNLPVRRMEQPAPAADATSPSGGDLGTRISGTANALELPEGIRCTLTVLNGPDSGRKIAFDRPRILVGRENGDLPLTDKEVSREHCSFEISGVTCTVKDLGSRNGTWVDGERIQAQQLSNVGEVVVGNSTLLFTMTLGDPVQEG